jgi:hypothetical protein
VGQPCVHARGPRGARHVSVSVAHATSVPKAQLRASGPHTPLVRPSCMHPGGCCTQGRRRAWGWHSLPAARRAGARPQQSHSRAAPRSLRARRGLPAARQKARKAVTAAALRPFRGTCHVHACSRLDTRLPLLRSPPSRRRNPQRSHSMPAFELRVILSGWLSALHAALMITGDMPVGVAQSLPGPDVPGAFAQAHHRPQTLVCLLPCFCAQAKHSQTGVSTSNSWPAAHCARRQRVTHGRPHLRLDVPLPQGGRAALARQVLGKLSACPHVALRQPRRQLARHIKSAAGTGEVTDMSYQSFLQLAPWLLGSWSFQDPQLGTL